MPKNVNTIKHNITMCLARYNGKIMSQRKPITSKEDFIQYFNNLYYWNFTNVLGVESTDVIRDITGMLNYTRAVTYVLDSIIPMKTVEEIVEFLTLLLRKDYA